MSVGWTSCRRFPSSTLRRLRSIGIRRTCCARWICQTCPTLWCGTTSRRAVAAPPTRGGNHTNTKTEKPQKHDAQQRDAARQICAKSVPLVLQAHTPLASRLLHEQGQAERRHLRRNLRDMRVPERMQPVLPRVKPRCVPEHNRRILQLLCDGRNLRSVRAVERLQQELPGLGRRGLDALDDLEVGGGDVRVRSVIRPLVCSANRLQERANWERSMWGEEGAGCAL